MPCNQGHIPFPMLFSEIPQRRGGAALTAPKSLTVTITHRLCQQQPRQCPVGRARSWGVSMGGRVNAEGNKGRDKPSPLSRQPTVPRPSGSLHFSSFREECQQGKKRGVLNALSNLWERAVAHREGSSWEMRWVLPEFRLLLSQAPPPQLPHAPCLRTRWRKIRRGQEV